MREGGAGGQAGGRAGGGGGGREGVGGWDLMDARGGNWLAGCGTGSGQEGRGAVTPSFGSATAAACARVPDARLGVAELGWDGPLARPLREEGRWGVEKRVWVWVLDWLDGGLGALCIESSPVLARRALWMGKYAGASLDGLPRSSSSSSSVGVGRILAVRMSSTTAVVRCDAAASSKETGERPFEAAKFLHAVMTLFAVAETLVLDLIFCCDSASSLEVLSPMSWMMSRTLTTTGFT